MSIWSRGRILQSRPELYKSPALLLSYLGDVVILTGNNEESKRELENKDPADEVMEVFPRTSFKWASSPGKLLIQVVLKGTGPSKSCALALLGKN